MANLKKTSLVLFKNIVYYSPFKEHFRYYKYNFTPPQLYFLCQCVEDTRNIEGAIAEVGCSEGRTTTFINKYMDAKSIDKAYYAIDTFSGFVDEDIKFEQNSRDKPKNWSYIFFNVNNKKWFDETMRQDNIDRVRSIEADVNKFDLTTLGPLSFCLLDVDLYRPIKKSLKEIYDVLSPGGIIVVDDCDPSVSIWDGSDQAYKEFAKEINQPYHILHGKLGVIRKPTHDLPNSIPSSIGE
jgi:O-methyltransferase